MGKPCELMRGGAAHQLAATGDGMLSEDLCRRLSGPRELPGEYDEQVLSIRCCETTGGKARQPASIKVRVAIACTERRGMCVRGELQPHRHLTPSLLSALASLPRNGSRFHARSSELGSAEVSSSAQVVRQLNGPQRTCNKELGQDL